MISRFKYAIAGWVWLFIVLSLTAYNASSLFLHNNIQFDLMALLPESKTVKMQAASQFMEDANISKKLVIMLGNADKKLAKKAIQELRQQITAQKLPIAEVNSHQIATEYKQLFKTLYAHRVGLISKNDRQLLLQGQGEILAQRAISEIMMPFSTFRSGQIKDDPFGLYTQFVTSVNVQTTIQRDSDGDLYLRYNGKVWYLFQAHIADTAFSLQLQKDLTEKLTPVLTSISHDNEILKTGAIFYATAGAQQAEKEISKISTISLLGIILILLLIFKTSRPVLLAVTVVTSGLMAGLAACLFFFGSIHILALVFGCSLVGVAVDYALHYFCASYKRENDLQINRFKILKSLMPALPLGVLSSSVGYGLLIVAPFPGIQQMAILSCIGLLCTFISVCLWGPYFIKTKTTYTPYLGEKIQSFLEKFASIGNLKYMRISLSVLLLTIFAIGSFNLSFEDNVRSFQSLDPGLKDQENTIKAMIKFDNSSKFLVVSGRTLEEMLQTEEAIVAKLDRLHIKHKAIAELLPSVKRQLENRALAKVLYQQHHNKIKETLGTVHPLNLKSQPLLKKIMPLPSGWGELISNSGIGRITLHTSVDNATIENIIAQYPNVKLIDPVSEYSSFFTSYREIMIILVLSVLLGIAVLLAIRQGLKPALLIVSPVLLSILTSVGILGLCSEAFTLFHAMGLMLVLCIGIDYALFLYWRPLTEHKGDLLLLGNCLAALTTILSFGLLVLSDTPAIHGFGFAVFVGIVSCFLVTTILLGKHNYRYCK